ncbi:MAG: SurA N-terminal domain-containing protein [Armatimonadota bacterium]
MTAISRVRTLAIALVVGGGALLSAGCGGGGGDDTVIAVVNGEKVTKSQYLKKLETMSSVRGVNPPQSPLQPGQTGEVQVAEPLSGQALTKIIDEILTLQTAKDEGVLPSKEDVDREQALMEQLNPNYVKNLKALGFTLEDIRRQLMVRLAERNLLVRGIPKKTAADAKQYIAEHPEEFTVPAQVRMRWIVLDDPNLRDDVDRELASGITFGAVAGKYSTAVNARAENGAFPPGRGAQPTPQPIPDEATNPFWEAVLKTPKGRVSDWVQLPGSGGKTSYIKLLIEDKTEKTVRKLSAAEEEMVRRALEEREARDVNDLTDLYLKKLLDAKVEINVPYLKATWEQQLAMIKDRAARMDERIGNAPAPAPSGPGTETDGQ